MSSLSLTTKRFAMCTTAIAVTIAFGAMFAATTSGANAASTTPLFGLGQRMFSAQNGQAPKPAAAPKTSTTTSASTSTTSSASTATSTSAPSKPKQPAAATPQAAATANQKPNYRDPQTTIDQFKKTPPTAYLCEAGRSGCYQKYVIPNGKGGTTTLDLHFTGLHGKLLPADQARLDKALANAETVYLSRPGGGNKPLDIHTVQHAN